MHLARLASMFAIGAILMTGCAPTGTAPSSAAPSASPSSGPTSYDVQVDSKSQAFNFQADAYFPNVLKAHPGDTIRFKNFDRGVPHTVTFGTMVDTAVASLEKQPSPAPNAAPPPPTPELFKLPRLITRTPPPTAPQAAAQPCFLASGEPPADVKTPCSKDQQTQKDFDGSQSYFNSGWLGQDQTFSLKLADTIKPGTYKYICLLHLDLMTGQLTVVDKSQPSDTQQQVKANADKQLNDYVAKLKPEVDAASKATADRAQAGVITSNPPSFQATLFAPKEISVPVGGSVSWTIFGPHTISFNVPQDAVGILTKGADGTVSTNLKALGPTGGPGQPAPPAPGSPAGPSPTVVDAGTWDGKGFLSSGLFRPAPPAVFAYKLTFTQAGTYPFRCVIHSDMEGTVKVGQ